MATLREIAEEAGVSIRSVTRALKGESGGNLETCRRIREIANRMGYIPNVAARNLRMKRNNMIGVITSGESCQIFVRKTISLQRKLEHEGFFPLSGLLPETPERLRELLQNWVGMVECVVFYSWCREWNPNEIFSGLPINCIFIDTLSEEYADSYTLVDIERETGIRIAVEHFIDNGRKRIAYLGSKMRERISGFTSAFHSRGIEPLPGAIIDCSGLTFNQGYQRGGAVISGGFDAVFTDTDRTALGFYRYCYEHGVRIPDDIAVIGFDNDEAGEYACPQLSSVAHPVDQISQQVTEFIKRSEYPKTRIVFPTKFIQRNSSPCDNAT